MFTLDELIKINGGINCLMCTCYTCINCPERCRACRKGQLDELEDCNSYDDDEGGCPQIKKIKEDKKMFERQERYKARSLRRYGEGEEYTLRYTVRGEEKTLKGKHKGGWIWETEVDCGDGEIRTYEYYTDKNGEGLWRNDRQISGTCQYHAPTSRSGMLRKIKRELEED